MFYNIRDVLAQIHIQFINIHIVRIHYKVLMSGCLIKQIWNINVFQII